MFEIDDRNDSIQFLLNSESHYTRIAANPNPRVRGAYRTSAPRIHNRIYLFPTIMSKLLAIPNEILDEIVSNLDARTTFHLLLTCRSLSIALKPTMHRHAIAPKKRLPALHWAAWRGHLPLVQYLLTIFPVNLPDSHGETALHKAAYSGHLHVTEHLLQHGADITRTNHLGQTAFIAACVDAIMRPVVADPTIRLLLAHGAVVPSEVSYRELRYAIERSSPHVFRLLLAAGASPHAHDADSEPLLLTAARQVDGEEILELLLATGVDIDGSNNQRTTAVMVAAKNGHLNMVTVLADKGANLNIVDNNGTTAMGYACIRGNKHVVEYLVGCEGFDINGGDVGAYFGDATPLDLAVSYGYDTALRVLLKRGAATDRLDTVGRSVFHSAVLYENQVIVETLLENGADLEIVDTQGQTPLAMAIAVHNVKMVERLLEYWPGWTGGSADRFMLLKVGCFRGSWMAVELLLARGLDVNVVDAEGLTVMAHARRDGLSEVVERLALYGED